MKAHIFSQKGGAGYTIFPLFFGEYMAGDGSPCFACHFFHDDKRGNRALSGFSLFLSLSFVHMACVSASTCVNGQGNCLLCERCHFFVVGPFFTHGPHRGQIGSHFLVSYRVCTQLPTFAAIVCRNQAFYTKSLFLTACVGKPNYKSSAYL